MLQQTYKTQRYKWQRLNSMKNIVKRKKCQAIKSNEVKNNSDLMSHKLYVKLKDKNYFFRYLQIILPRKNHKSILLSTIFLMTLYLIFANLELFTEQLCGLDY